MWWRYSLFGCVVCMAIMGYVGNFGKLDILDSHFPLWDRYTGPEILERMGDDGRQRYLTINQIDFVFPFFYATFLSEILYSRGYILGVCISLGAGLFDLMENMCIRILLQSSQQIPSNFESIALDYGPMFTRLKWGFLTCALILFTFSFFLTKKTGKFKGK